MFFRLSDSTGRTAARIHIRFDHQVDLDQGQVKFIFSRS